MRADDEAGFTLMEMLVTLGVAALIGAIVFPNLQRGVGRAGFDEAVAGVRADLRMARAQALTLDAPVILTVAADGRSYGWTGGPDRGLVAGLTLAAPDGDLRFGPDGSAAGGALTLTGGPLRARFAPDAATGLPDAAPDAPR